MDAPHYRDKPITEGAPLYHGSRIIGYFKGIPMIADADLPNNTMELRRTMAGSEQNVEVLYTREPYRVIVVSRPSQSLPRLATVVLEVRSKDATNVNKWDIMSSWTIGTKSSNGLPAGKDPMAAVLELLLAPDQPVQV